jgi:hypothetical protein
MKRIILIALCLACIVGTVSAYGLYVSCPESVQIGLPLKCSIDSDLPAGYSFDIVLYQTQYTATEINRQYMTMQGDNKTHYTLFDTQGLPGGNYKVESQFKTTDSGMGLRSDSITMQLVKFVDRSGEIQITSPLTQNLNEALRIEGSIKKLGNDGIEIEVRDPDKSVIFGPQWIGTANDIRSGDGVFTKQVTVNGPGDYYVHFRDAKGYVGMVTFHIAAPATQAPATLATTTPAKTTRVPTTIPTPIPTTQSPLSPVVAIGSLGIAGLLAVAFAKKR